MALEGVDYAHTESLANEQCFVNNGKIFVVRYHDASGGTSAKCLDAAEVASLHSAGLYIDVCYETCGGAPGIEGCPAGVAYFTPAQGTFDAQTALARAAACGQPSSSPIYFAIDYDASDADLATITEYFNAIYTQFAGAHPIGVYGSYRVVEYAGHNWPGVPYRWQTYAWSGTQLSGFVSIYQFLNSQYLCNLYVDMDRQFDASAW